MISYTTLQVSNYKPQLTVTSPGNSAEIKWRGKIYRAFMANPRTPQAQGNDDAVNAIKSYYVSGLSNLKSYTENK